MKNQLPDKEQLLADFVYRFVQKDKAERCYAQLTHPKNRHKFVDRLNHNWESVLDMRRLTPIPKPADSLEAIQKKLGWKNDDMCYIISNYSEFDDRFMPCEQAFFKLYSRGFGSILLNLSADALFLDTEQVQGPAERFIGKYAPQF